MHFVYTRCCSRCLDILTHLLCWQPPIAYIYIHLLCLNMPSTRHSTNQTLNQTSYGQRRQDRLGSIKHICHGVLPKAHKLFGFFTLKRTFLRSSIISLVGMCGLCLLGCKFLKLSKWLWTVSMFKNKYSLLPLQWVMLSPEKSKCIYILLHLYSFSVSSWFDQMK